MIKISCSCIVKGDKFSPKKYEKLSGLKFSKSIEPGEPGLGKYKKTKSPYGWANLKPNENVQVVDEENKIIPFLKLLIKERKNFITCGADKIIIDLAIDHDEQCNLEFDKNILKLLYKASDFLHMSCYYSPDEFA